MLCILQRSVYNDTVNSGDHRSRTIPTSRPQLSPVLEPYVSVSKI